MILSLALLSVAPAAVRADSLVWPTQGYQCLRSPPSPSCEFKLWRADADGGNAGVVGAGQGDVLWPQWSRDGRRIVFHRQVDETPDALDPIARYEVFTMAGDGSGARRLTDGAETLDMQPTISPGGEDVAWWRSGFDESIGFEVGGIWLMRADGSDQRRLVDLPGNESTPEFSADGQRVAFTRNVPGASDGAAPSVWSVRQDGTDLRQLSTGNLPARVPKFSPDGRFVSFFSGDSLVVMALDGTGVRAYPVVGNTAAWSSDGRYLAALGFMPPDGSFSLWRIDAHRPEAPPLLVRDLKGEGGPAHPGWVAGATPPSRPDDTGPSFVVGVTHPRSGGPVHGSMRAVGGRRVQRPLTVRDPERLRFAAADRSGLRHLTASVTAAGAAPRFRRIRGHRDWRRLTGHLRPGTYMLRVQARDTSGNPRRAGRPLTLRVR